MIGLFEMASQKRGDYHAFSRTVLEVYAQFHVLPSPPLPHLDDNLEASSSGNPSRPEEIPIATQRPEDAYADLEKVRSELRATKEKLQESSARENTFTAQTAQLQTLLELERTALTLEKERARALQEDLERHLANAHRARVSMEDGAGSLTDEPGNLINAETSGLQVVPLERDVQLLEGARSPTTQAALPPKSIDTSPSQYTPIASSSTTANLASTMESLNVQQGITSVPLEYKPHHSI